MAAKVICLSNSTTYEWSLEFLSRRTLSHVFVIYELLVVVHKFWREVNKHGKEIIFTNTCHCLVYCWTPFFVGRYASYEISIFVHLMIIFIKRQVAEASLTCMTSILTSSWKASTYSEVPEFMEFNIHPKIEQQLFSVESFLLWWHSMILELLYQG